MSLTESQYLGRAKNAIGSFFDRRLSVPKIFFDVSWDGEMADVLAIDRAGVGDVHLTVLSQGVFEAQPDAYDFAFSRELQVVVSSLISRRSQYRHVALRTNSFSAADRRQLLQGWEIMSTFADDGIGRVGLLLLDVSAGEPEVHQIVKAERFRSTRELLALTDSFVTAHTADLEYRDPIYEQEAAV